MGQFKIYNQLSREMSDDLSYFVELMVKKLEKNRHKDALEPPDLPKLMRLAMGEMGEMVEQLLRDETDPNMLLECADTANFMFLIAIHIKRKLHAQPV